MAVVAVWKCDRDGSMFADKKAAEEHDKMLELAANISAMVEQHIDADPILHQQLASANSQSAGSLVRWIVLLGGVAAIAWYFVREGQ